MSSFSDRFPIKVLSSYPHLAFFFFFPHAVAFVSVLGLSLPPVPLDYTLSNPRPDHPSLLSYMYLFEYETLSHMQLIP